MTLSLLDFYVKPQTTHGSNRTSSSPRHPLQTDYLTLQDYDLNDYFDKYGFKRSYDVLSKEEWEAFEKYYSVLCEKRLQKWDALWALEKENGTLENGFPSRTDKRKKGIPHSYRSQCWFHYSGAEAVMRENEGLYTILSFREQQDVAIGYTSKTNKILEHIEVLGRDLLRTFPDNLHFTPRLLQDIFKGTSRAKESLSKESIYIKSLRNVLVAFAYYSWPHPDPNRSTPKTCTYAIGYCQSLNFIVGLLLLVYAAETDFESNPTTQTLVEEKVFWTLVVIVEELMPPEMYGSTLEGAQVEQDVLWKWIVGKKGGKFGCARVAEWVEDMDEDGPQPSKSPMPPLNMITTQWFMTLFVNVLPIETVLRIWDCFFYQGEKILIRMALTLIKIHEDQILAFDEPMEAWKFIKDIPRGMIHCHKLMELCFRPRIPLNPLSYLQDNPVFSTAHDDAAPVCQNMGKIKRGVGPIPKKLIEKYREIALEEKRRR